MNTIKTAEKVAIIAGVGNCLGAALSQALLSRGYTVCGLSRSAAALPDFGEKYIPVACDLTNQSSVDSALTHIEEAYGHPCVYIHNAAYLLQQDFLNTSAEDFTALWEVICLGALHGFQRVLPNMIAGGNGTILATGATASIKAGAKFAAFSSAKFALRGLVQSLAREFGPQGVHFAHIIIDGVIWGEQARSFGLTQRACLQSSAVAENYVHLINQHRSAWTHELDLRPDIERF